MVWDNHIKETELTQYISMFSSGAQDYCEILRGKVKVSGKVNDQTSIDEIALIVEEVSKDDQYQFEKENPMYLVKNPEFSPLSGYYAASKNVTGTIEYCHKEKMRRISVSMVTVRGEDREEVLSFFQNNQMDQNNIVETVFNLFKHINRLNKNVGGDTILHVVTPNGIYVYNRGSIMYLSRNVKMGPYASSSWDQVANQPFIPRLPDYNQSTYINATQILSPNIYGGTIAIGSGNNIFKADNRGIYFGHSAFENVKFKVSLDGKLQRLMECFRVLLMVQL
ncbi:hypothetical protein PAEAM_06520 [Paenibacillus sp. GM1FR]|uniref:hypothetical protein n=1 Tax=Paenibacillus sp. GM1FR TaxID=2059267 RepID=UPI000C27AB9C|nr:hypothetical protein [Paenibacillus sp. GM1FR]PJN64566.1 hypothetical protein PAEAM_06520 [Paenibacillus sp. GM1FR]